MSDTATTRKVVEIPATKFSVRKSPEPLAEPKTGAGRQTSPVLGIMAGIVAKSKRNTPYSVPCVVDELNEGGEPTGDTLDMTPEQVEAVSRYLRTAANAAGHGIRMELHPGEIRFQLGEKKVGVGRPKGSKNGQ